MADLQQTAALVILFTTSKLQKYIWCHPFTFYFNATSLTFWTTLVSTFLKIVLWRLIIVFIIFTCMVVIPNLIILKKNFHLHSNSTTGLACPILQLINDIMSFQCWTISYTTRTFPAEHVLHHFFQTYFQFHHCSTKWSSLHTLFSLVQLKSS